MTVHDSVEALLVEAYQRGWREGCETLVEDYPDALVAVPHKDAMGEGCGTFMGEICPRIERLSPTIAEGVLREALEPFASERLSNEPTMSDCLYRSPAAMVRLQAEAIEQRDANILRARAALEGNT